MPGPKKWKADTGRHVNVDLHPLVTLALSLVAAHLVSMVHISLLIWQRVSTLQSGWPFAAACPPGEPKPKPTDQTGNAKHIHSLGLRAWDVAWTGYSNKRKDGAESSALASTHCWVGP